ncbi:adenosylcobyric acid synthase [Planomicrobium stackebrandtii]|uniref:Cobyric acid synthase n=1 Tax=Planomicrobium stackebrandtii TaxID=253160 RepID=A0ABU0GSE0_9BACL|nr:cobyric acid synthase [Planomicrobium stackebrandtii]MDQ0428280.1 adenosylcobyric acid synthase [Planomicrobium stackebrandtii]
MRGIMIQGTASDVGKSMICTAFCRIFSDQGLQVAPFKSQNMSNNSYVTIWGEEIGRSQGVQAEAARTVATVNMNPILLKPESDMKSQVVLFGKKLETMDGMDYRVQFYEKGLAAIDQALANLAQDFTHVVIEGAGSPAEVNLNDRELVNMAVASRADVPVILVADIERGGVFASIVGTLALMPEPERVKGLIINKFRGDIRLFEDGIRFLESYTGIPVLGVIPHLPSHEIEQEDSLGVQAVQRVSGVENAIELVICRHPYISNFTDVEPFLNERDVTIRWAETVEDIGQPDILLVPGTKSTIADLRYWKEQGLEIKLLALKGSTWIVGLCGGFQMFADTLSDPEGYDGTKAEKEAGFGLVQNMHVHFEKQKVVQRTSGIVKFPNTEVKVAGYEIHHGVVTGTAYPLIESEDFTEGYFHDRLLGTHLHGFFRDPRCRNAFLAPIRKQKNLPESLPETVTDPFDRWAKHVKEHLDWQKVEQIMEADQ